MNRNEEMRGYVSMDGENITPYFHLSLKILYSFNYECRQPAIILAIPTSVLPIESAETSLSHYNSCKLRKYHLSFSLFQNFGLYQIYH